MNSAQPQKFDNLLGGWNVSPQDLAKLMSMPEARQLLAMLSQDGGSALRQAAGCATQGDYQGARTVLEPMLNTPEAAGLIDEIIRKQNPNGRI